MVLPLVVIDEHEEVAKNPDYTLSLDRLKKWEKDHGQIPAGAFVAMRTDWSKRWPYAAKTENKDANGAAHYPGWIFPALKSQTESRIRFPCMCVRDLAISRANEPRVPPQNYSS